MSNFSPNLLLDLPIELFEMVMSYMSPEIAITLTFAAYLPLYERGRVFTLSQATHNYILSPASHPTGRFSQLPAELVLNILRQLSYSDQVALALAEYHDLRQLGIAPDMTAMIRRQLHFAYLRGRP
jgi:hypothetical protein